MKIPETGQPSALLVLDGRRPTFQELAGEAFELARKGTFPDTLADRIAYWRNGRRLNRVARWSEVNDWSSRSFMWDVGIRRYAVGIFALPAMLLAIYAIRESRALPLGFIWILFLFAIMSSLIGLGMAASLQSRMKEDIPWAEAYRNRRIEVDERLRSPSGYQGWRVTKDSNGMWVFRSADGEEPS